MISITQQLEQRLTASFAHRPPVGMIGLRTRPVRGGLEFAWNDAVGFGGYLCRCLNDELVEVTQRALAVIAEVRRTLPTAETPKAPVHRVRKTKVTDRKAEAVWRRKVAA